MEMTRTGHVPAGLHSSLTIQDCSNFSWIRVHREKSYETRTILISQIYCEKKGNHEHRLFAHRRWVRRA